MPSKTGSYVKSLRHAAGLKQTELAEKTGIPIDSIRAYEQGKVDPPLSRVLLIQTATGGGVSAKRLETEREARGADAGRQAAITVFDAGSGRVWFEINLTPILRVLNPMQIGTSTETNANDFHPDKIARKPSPVE